MAHCLLEHGHEVTMVCGSFSGNKTGLKGNYVNGFRRGLVNGLDIIEFDLAYSNSDTLLSRTWTFFKYVFRSLKIIFFERYDLVFATTTPLTAGIPGIIARWLRNKPFVFEVRDLWPELPKAMGVIKNPLILYLMSILEWLSYHSANHLIALSPGITNGIENRGIKSDLISMIPNGCDLNIFDAEINLLRPDSIQPNDFIAIFAGTHGVANGLNNILDVAAELCLRKRNDIKIILIGDGKLKRSLIARADKDRLENIIFMDPINKKGILSLMSKSDLGLQILSNIPAFYYGTSPNKFFDYISAGMPVLTNYPGWIADIILANDIGFVVPPDNPIKFANVLEKAADNRNNLKIKGLNAKQLAFKDFNRKEQASHWVKIMEQTHKKHVKKRIKYGNTGS